MLIIQIDALEGNFHPFQSQSHRKECWLEGWIAVPPALEHALYACGGHCELLIEGDTLLEILPREMPQLPHEPTPDEDRDAMLIDLEYRLTLIELGVI